MWPFTSFDLFFVLLRASQKGVLFSSQVLFYLFKGTVLLIQRRSILPVYHSANRVACPDIVRFQRDYNAITASCPSNPWQLQKLFELTDGLISQDFHEMGDACFCCSKASQPECLSRMTSWSWPWAARELAAATSSSCMSFNWKPTSHKFFCGLIMMISSQIQPDQFLASTVLVSRQEIGENVPPRLTAFFSHHLKAMLHKGEEVLGSGWNDDQHGRAEAAEAQTCEPNKLKPSKLNQIEPFWCSSPGVSWFPDPARPTVAFLLLWRLRQIVSIAPHALLSPPSIGPMDLCKSQSSNKNVTARM